MIWTLTFVSFLLTGDAQVGGGVFTTKGKCEAIRVQLLDAVAAHDLPSGAQTVVIGQCQIWVNPKNGLNP
jgi:hypothetical protein